MIILTVQKNKYKDIVKKYEQEKENEVHVGIFKKDHIVNIFWICGGVAAIIASLFFPNNEPIGLILTIVGGVNIFLWLYSIIYSGFVIIKNAKEFSKEHK
jgi:hypothetical protein